MKVSTADWVSLSRIPTAILIVLFLHNKLLVVALFILALFTDWLDGKLAKGTSSGAIIDPMADKIFALIVGLVLLWQFSWYYIALFFLRDIFTVLAIPVGYMYKVKEVKARWWGKTTTVVQFIALIIIFLNTDFALFSVMAIALFSVLAIVEYAWWFKNEIARV